MKRLLVAFFLSGAVACAPCQTRSDCDDGEYCDFTSGDCKVACESNADCDGRAICDRAKGQCVIAGTSPLRDGGTNTSTAADGGS